MIEVKENLVQKLQKAEGEDKGLTKDINNMRAAPKTLTYRLGEEGSTTIEDLKRQMVLMTKENRRYSVKERKK